MATADVRHTPKTATSRAIRIVIADDHAMFSDALKRLVMAEAGLAVVGVAATSDDAVRMTRDQQPDVMLLNLAMRSGALDVLRAVCAASAGATRTLVLAGPADKDTTVRALQLGACGVVGKHSGTDALLTGIRRVSRGQYSIESRHVGEVVQAVKQMAGQAAQAPGANPYGLTPRERQMVECVTRGDSNRAIAARAGITEDTVKHHLSNIFDKLGVYSRLELAMFAVNHKLVETTLQRKAV